eukprot:1160317-Pelagomonas_calceolata.AAC.9
MVLNEIKIRGSEYKGEEVARARSAQAKAGYQETLRQVRGLGGCRHMARAGISKSRVSSQKEEASMAYEAKQFFRQDVICVPKSTKLGFDNHLQALFLGWGRSTLAGLARLIAARQSYHARLRAINTPELCTRLLLLLVHGAACSLVLQVEAELGGLIDITAGKDFVNKPSENSYGGLLVVSV